MRRVWSKGDAMKTMRLMMTSVCVLALAHAPSYAADVANGTGGKPGNAGSGQDGNTKFPYPPAPASADSLPPSVQAAFAQQHAKAIGANSQAMLKTDEVNSFRKRVMDNQEAVANPSYDPNEGPPDTIRKDVDFVMEPGRDPEKITMSKWAPAPFTFLDTRKRAITVEGVSYNLEAFRINGRGCDSGGSGEGEQGGKPANANADEMPATTVLYVSACRPSEWGSISVKLAGYPVPVVFVVTVSPKASQVDLPVVLTVHSPAPPPSKPVRRPRPKPPVAAADDGNGPSPLWSFMSGTPPQGAVPVQIGGGARAWTYGGATYVRADGHLNGGTASAEATSGQTTVLKFDTPHMNQIHLTRPDGQEETLTVGSGAVR